MKRKLFKFINLFLLLIITIFSLTSCDSDSLTPTTKEIASNLIKLVTLEDTNIDDVIILPSSVGYDNYSANLDWSLSNNNATLKEEDGAIKLYPNRGFQELKTRLTCKLNYNGETREKDFNLTILSYDEQQIIAKLRENIDFSDREVNDNFTLPLTTTYDDFVVDINWSSSSDNIRINRGIAEVRSTTKQEEVILTASFTLNNKTYNNYYTISVLPLVLEYITINDNSAYDSYYNTTVYKGSYYIDAYEVALYIIAFDELPSNYVDREEFNRNDWTSENMLSCCGGVFQNREGILPSGDSYIELDINYNGGSRGAERLVFSYDTLNFYYTTDHYVSFLPIYLNAIPGEYEVLR